MEETVQQSFTILVIDDDERVRNLLRDILLFAGHRVIEASDGISGIQCLEKGGFDMVLTDLGMPVMNGWEVVKWIKSNTPHIPVGLITGWGTDLEEEKIKESGVDWIIGKPFQVHEILEAINHFNSSH